MQHFVSQKDPNILFLTGIKSTQDELKRPGVYVLVESL